MNILHHPNYCYFIFFNYKYQEIDVTQLMRSDKMLR